MYWFRTENGAVILVWIGITLIHTIGGWLIATHAVNLHSKERILTGFGIGLVLYLWFCNFIGRWVDPTLTFVVSAIVVLGIGISYAWFSPRPFFHREDLTIWPWILSGLALVWVFLRVSKGTGMFDEYKNLALISVIANGEIPVREHPELKELFRYHYGYHIWGASLMRLGGLMPWSAYDLSKSIIWGYTILLAGLLGKRHIENSWGPVLMGAVTTLAGGTRFLLLLLPTRLLISLNETIQLIGVSQELGNFIEAMKSGWIADGTPPVDYPFAFLSGINQPYVMTHTGSGTLEITMLFLFILMVPKIQKKSSFILLTLFLSFWALTAEASFVLICLGIAVYFLGQYNRKSQIFQQWKHEARLYLISILIAAVLSVVQGGTISAIIQDFMIESQTQPSSSEALNSSNQHNDFLGFSIRWPPAILSAHLGTLPLLSPIGIMAAICELGIIVLFLPWLTIQVKRIDPKINWMDRILLISAWFGIIIPIFIQWKSPRDITRLTAFGMSILVYLTLVYLTRKEQRIHAVVYRSAWLSLALMMFGGVVLAGTQLTASPDTIYSEKYKDFDAIVLSQVWGKIPHDSKIFGPVGKGSILTGQLTAGIFDYPPGDEGNIWHRLRIDPSLDLFLENGFEFVYFDSKSGLAFQEEVHWQDCVKVFGYAEDGSGKNFTGFYDLRGCYRSSK